MEKRNLLEKDVYDNFLNRLEQLTPNTQASWGKMNAAQMLAHCTEVQKVISGATLDNVPLMIRLFKGSIKKSILAAKPFKKGIPTHPKYVQLDEKEFGLEKNRLIETLNEFRSMDTEKLSQIPHSLFGKMSANEKGWLAYKHLDHHLSQFNL